MNQFTNPGCVVLLLDESAGMGAVMGDVVAEGKISTKSNAERVATALNSLLKQLSAGPAFDLALVGYQADGAGQTNIGSRWRGALGGKDFVSTGELAAAPLRVETRTRRVPVPGSIGAVQAVSVDFPIWYEPTLGAKAPQVAAFDYCCDLLGRWAATAGPDPAPPLVLHVFSGSSADGNPQRAVDKLMDLATPGGKPLLFQAHLAASASAVTAAYPSNFAYLTMGFARDLFRRCSPLPPHLIAALKAAKVHPNAAAKGMLYNAKIVDLVRFFDLVPSHVLSWLPKGGASVPHAAAAIPAAAPATALAPAPPADPLSSAVSLAEPAAGDSPTLGPAEISGLSLAAETPVDLPPREKAGLVVLLLDRSIEDLFGGNLQNSCARLQEHANEILQQISRLKRPGIDAAIVSYGRNSFGEVEVRDTFDGPLAGRAIVPAAELEAGALRVDQHEEEVYNGMGGLTKVTRKKPVFFDLEPAEAAPPSAAFAAAGKIAGQWSAAHPSACLPPIVLHLTRGRFEPAAIEEAASQLQTATAASGPATLYHLVVTESPHKSLAYPDSPDGIQDPGLQALWRETSPLLGRQRLCAAKPTVKEQSRGMVINGKFDLLLDEVDAAMSAGE
jgi:hypothetical protein